MREELERYQKEGFVRDVVYFAKGFTAVAAAVLFVRRDFGRGAPEIGQQEYRIVPETMYTARLIGDHSFDETGNDGEYTPALRERGHADESRAAIRSGLTLHRVQKLSHAIGVGAFRPRVARRINAGRAAKCRNHKPRILSHQKLIRKAAVV